MVSSGGCASPRMVGPERATISMLRGGSHHSPFERTSQPECEASGGSGSSAGDRGVVAGSPKMGGLLCSVTERLNEMSVRGRPPTPLGTSGDANTALAHLAPRRAHSRFASPSRSDSLPMRKSSYSGMQNLPCHSAQQASSPLTGHTRPASPMPRDLTPERGASSFTARLSRKSVSPSRSSSHTTAPGSMSAPHTCVSPRTSLSGLSHRTSPSVKSPSHSWHPLAPTPQHEPNSAPDAGQAQHRLSCLSRGSMESNSAPLQKLSGLAMYDAPDNGPASCQDNIIYGSSPPVPSPMGTTRLCSTSKTLPTIPDDDSLRSFPQAPLEPMRGPAVDGSHPMYFSTSGSRKGPREPDSLSSWMQSR